MPKMYHSKLLVATCAIRRWLREVGDDWPSLGSHAGGIAVRGFLHAHPKLQHECTCNLYKLVHSTENEHACDVDD